MVPAASQSLSKEANEQRPRKRVRMACNRCRRQKLKCDTKRPCALCSRSGVECVTDSRDLPWHKDKDRESAVDSSGSPITVSSRPDQTLPEALLPNPWLSEQTWQQTSFHEASQPDENTTVPRNYPRDTSAVKLTQEILQHLSPDTSFNADTSELPGGSGNNTILSSGAVKINQILGLDLPSKVVSDKLFNAYFDSVHWFMVLFHEPSFRQRYDAIILTGQATPEDLPFLVCLMLVLAIGARYINRESDISPEVADTDLDDLQNNLLNSTRMHLLDIVELGGVEGVQICVLLSTFYLYHDRPNLAFAIHGMGVKCAHTMCLHQEATWKETTTLAREVKRRVWWALYVVDCFYSIIFGRPRSIRDEESHVAMVRNLEDTAARHPYFNSTENVGESSYPVTIFSYQRYKFILYTIAARVMRDIYFDNSSTSLTSVSHAIRLISRDLESWFQSLPLELKHPSDNDSEFAMQQDQNPLTSNTVRIFRLQAMALQLAYDNIQILLHRPLLQLPLGLCSPSYVFHGMSSMDALNVNGKTANKPNPSAVDSTTLALSKTQCYKSAVRTACLNASIIKEARHTHAASYIGIQLFTAGVVLSLVALSVPLSSEAHQAKQAIGRIAATTASIGNKTLLSTQSQNVLRELVRVILQKEMNSIFAETAAQPDALNHEKQTLKNRSQTLSSKSVPVSTQVEGYNFGSTSQPGTATFDPDSDSSMAQRSEVGTDIQQDELMQSTWNDILPAEDLNYNQAISSVQQVFSQPRRPQAVDSDWSSFPVTPSMLTESLELNGEPAQPFLFAAPGNGFQGAGQSWLWEDGLLQPVNTDSSE